jgi:predicted Zn-dependent peptidase
MDDRYANVLFGMILGGMTTSRFFSNIREKQSLCYYCSCFTHRGMRTLTAYAGVEPQNIERTRDAILKEFDDIRENGVTEEELERAKLEIINEASSTYDSVSAISGWYLSQLNDGEFITPEEYIERIKAVTPERVRAISGKYTLDTVYTLCGEERQ